MTRVNKKQLANNLENHQALTTKILTRTAMRISLINRAKKTKAAQSKTRKINLMVTKRMKMSRISRASMNLKPCLKKHSTKMSMLTEYLGTTYKSKESKLMWSKWTLI